MNCVVCKGELVEDNKQVEHYSDYVIKDGYHCPECKIKYVGESDDEG